MTITPEEIAAMTPKEALQMAKDLDDGDALACDDNYQETLDLWSNLMKRAKEPS